MPTPEIITTDKWLDVLLKAAGLGAGLAYFIYRVVTGYLTSNLALSLGVDRIKDTDWENLSVHVTVNKGDQGKIILYDMQVRVRLANAAQQDAQAVGSVSLVAFGNDVAEPEPGVIKRIDEIRRLTLNNTDDQIQYRKYSTSNKYLKLAPGDEMTFSCAFQIPIGARCIVDAVVLGRRPTVILRHRTGQWRSSCISLPNEDEAK